MYNSSVAMLDIFDSSKYSNANMCVMGTSGAGKTYLLQLLALRHRCQGTQLFIIVPLKGHEFRRPARLSAGGTSSFLPASQECVNIMEIRHRQRDVASKRDDSILADKIQKLHIFFTLIKHNITYEERHFLDNALVETYSRFGMTHENESLYDDAGELKPMPCLADLYAVLSETTETKLLSQARKVRSLSDEETSQIIRYKKGQGLFCSSFVRTCIGFASSMDEYELISTDRKAVAAKEGINSI